MDNETLDTILLAGASLVVGKALHMVAKRSWEYMYSEEPPVLNPSQDIDWSKAILWSVVTGTAISSAKLFTKRFILKKRYG